MNNLISREAAIKDAKSWVAVDEYEKYLKEIVIEWLKEFPSAELGTNLASLGTDCISRQAAIDGLRGYLVGKRCPDDGTLTCRLIENEVINKLPLAEPKRGKWVLVCDNNGMHFICNKCGAWRYHREQKFCGECGAKMREVNNESN